MTVLFSWLGNSDLNEIHNSNLPGPLGQALLSNKYNGLTLLTNNTSQNISDYLEALSQLLSINGIECEIDVHRVELEDPTDYSAIYTIVKNILDAVDAENRVFHLSPGTPAMASVWMVLSQGLYPSALIQSSRERGIREVHLPFRLESREVQKFSRAIDNFMRRGQPVHPAFDSMVSSNSRMIELKSRAQRAAVFDVPVLITGESGTGKELLARAIHNASSRAEGPFIAINCGAIPSELMESQLFGHKKGAFTSADKDYEGVFLAAGGGTLFLDEVGELPADMQVKLLRSLQEGEVLPVGSSQAVQTDVRIISATNRFLPNELDAGNFRSDLYYRLGVAIIKIPPLRDRGDDVLLLADHLLNMINDEFCKMDPDWERARLDKTGREFLAHSPWPGNVRQLENALKQAALWSAGGNISIEILSDSVGESGQTSEHRIYTSLQDELDAISRERILQVLNTKKWNRQETARVLGFKNHQTLKNWMTRLGLVYNDSQ